jgi:hypothetical protein
MAFRPLVAADLVPMDARCFVDDTGGNGGASLANAGGGHA